MDATSCPSTRDNPTPSTPPEKAPFSQTFALHQATLDCNKCKQQGTLSIPANSRLRHERYLCTKCNTPHTALQLQRQLQKQKQQKQQQQKQHEQQQPQQQPLNDDQTPPSSDSDMELAPIHNALAQFEHHPDLPDFMKLIMSQLTTMNNTINTLQAQLTARDTIIQQLQQSLASIPSPTLSPNPRPQQQQQQQQQQQPPTPPTDHTNPWSNKDQVQQLRQPLSSAPLSRAYQKTQAVARTFFPVSPTRGFTYLYLNTNKRLPTKELRRKFRRLGINTNRLIDIHYPTRNVIATLVHNDFQQEFVEQLATFGITPIDHFDPLDPQHIQNPDYTDDTTSQDEKEQFAFQTVNKRMTRTLQFVRESLRYAVSDYFIQEGWIDEVDRNITLNDLAPPTDAEPETSNADFLLPNLTNSTTTPPTNNAYD
ncbi:unnamed protein product [Absidia cylindrospora]